MCCYLSGVNSLNMNIDILDSFIHQLPMDENFDNNIRQVFKACGSYVNPTPSPSPKVIHINHPFAYQLGLSDEDLHSRDFLNVFSGNCILQGSKPFSMCYGGHQFGSWAGQLGDGRAINIFETMYNDKRWMLQLKGAGKTPFSRTADGKAVLRSSVREYLCSEAMHYLNIPTTRALSLLSTGENVLRDILYDGNPAFEPGAIVCRVAPTFIRFGNFQIHAARNEWDIVKQLTDYTINFFYPACQKLQGSDRYIQFFSQVMNGTLEMIIHWERVGFVHGVMNTDNMSILGLTIDYGPYGWVEEFDPNWTPNTTDSGERRYRFGNQANIAYWNLYQLANALFKIIEDKDALQNLISQFPEIYNNKSNAMWVQKLGLRHFDAKVDTLKNELFNLMYLSKVDFTIFFRKLSFETSLEDFWQLIQDSSYITDLSPLKERWANWYKVYYEIIISQEISNIERNSIMVKTNPKYIIRNYMAQMAIDEVTKGNYSTINELFDLLKDPYSENTKMEKWFVKRPKWADEKPGCSMLSCSS